MAIKIDCSKGGQVLRFALGLSCLLHKPFSIVNIRKDRPKPGLAQQHLHCVKICQELMQAKVQGAALGSQELLFIPQKRVHKPLEIAIPTAGSVTLLMQALGLALLVGKRQVHLHLEGGTDVPYSMPLDFYTQVVLHNLQAYVQSQVSVQMRGLYPQGGGSIAIALRPKYATVEQLPVFTQHVSPIAHIKGIVYATPSWQEMCGRLHELLSLALRQKYRVPVHIEIQHARSRDEGAGILLAGIMQGPLAIGYDTRFEDNDVHHTVERIIGSLDFSGFDEHYIDNIIPLLGLCTGSISVRHMTEHIHAAMEVTQHFVDAQFMYDSQEKMLHCQRRASSNS